MKKALLNLGMLSISLASVINISSCNFVKNSSKEIKNSNFTNDDGDSNAKTTSILSKHYLDKKLANFKVNEAVDTTLLELPSDHMISSSEVSAMYTINKPYNYDARTVRVNNEFLTPNGNLLKTQVGTIHTKPVNNILEDKRISKSVDKFSNSPVLENQKVAHNPTSAPDNNPTITIEQQKAILQDLRLPKRATLINNLNPILNIDEEVYNKAEYKFILAKDKMLSSSLNEVSKAIVDAQDAISTINKFNEDVLKENNWLEVKSSSNGFINNFNIKSMISDGYNGFFIGGDAGAVDHIDSNTQLIDGWKTKNFLDYKDINKIVSDEHNGFFIVGYDGKIDHIDVTGSFVNNWNTHTIFSGSSIISMIPDGHDGFFIGGWKGKIDHIDSNGYKSDDFVTRLLINWFNIFAMISDGHRGFLVVGGNGQLDHIDYDGNIINNEPTKTLLHGKSIFAISSDGHGGFFVGGDNGQLDHIDYNGDTIKGWTTKTLIGGELIRSIVSDGQNGYFVAGNKGRVDHINNNGQLIENWSTKILLNGNDIYSMISDRHGGFFIGGANGYLDHILYKLNGVNLDSKPAFNFNSDLAKFNDFNSSKTSAQLNSDIISTNPTATQLGFAEPELSSGTIALYSISKNLFHGQESQKIIVTLINNGQTSIKIFNLTPAFDFSSDLNHFVNLTSSKTINQLKHDISSTNPTAVQLGIIEPHLSEGTFVTYSMNSQIFKRGESIIITAHFNHNGETKIKTFNLTPGLSHDFTSDRFKFVDMLSKKNASQLANEIISTNPTATQLGINMPDLSEGTIATLSIDSMNFNELQPTRVLVHLKYGWDVDTTTFLLTPAHDFSLDKIKFVNAVSKKTSLQLNHDVLTINPSASQLGFTEPKLSQGVVASYSIEVINFSNTNPIDVVTTLRYHTKIAKVSFQLTPKLPGTVQELAQKLGNLEAPDKMLIFTSTSLVESLDSELYETNKSAFDLAKSKVSSMDIYELEKAISIAQNAIDNINKFNQKIINANNGLQINSKEGIHTNMSIHSMASDGHSGFFIGGTNGKVDHINLFGQIVDNWETKVFFGVSNIITQIISDGHGGYFVCGTNGKLDYMDGNGDKVENWQVKTFLHGRTISSIVPDGNDGFFLGGAGGQLDHINSSGWLVNGWQTKMTLDGNFIYSIVPDGNDGFLIGGQNGKLDHIDANGDFINDTWTTKTLLGGSAIHSIVSNGTDGFLVVGQNGKLDHIDANGNILSSTLDLLGGADIHSIISDKYGGFWIAGKNYKLDHIDANGKLINDDWKTITLSNSNFGTIYTMIPDRQYGFWIAGTNGINHLSYEPNKITTTPQAKYDFSGVIAQFVDSHSTKTLSEIRADTHTLTPTAYELGYFPPILSGTIAKYSIDSLNFASTLSPLIVHVTLFHEGELAITSFKLWPRYDFTSIKSQFVILVSSKTTEQLNHDINTLEVTPNQLGFAPPSELQDLVIYYKIESTKFIDGVSKKVTATLWHGFDHNTVTFYLKPKSKEMPFDFFADKVKFKDVLSFKNIQELTTDVTTVNPTAAQLGIQTPELSIGTTVTYSIDTIIFDGSDKIVTITLWHGLDNDTKTFKLKPLVPFDFSIDKSKFVDGISSKSALKLNNIISSIHPTATQLGFIEPENLSNDVIATYSIDSTVFVDGIFKKVSVTLTHGRDSAVTTFKLKPAFDFTSDLHKFFDMLSTKNSKQLTADIKSINPTATQLGIPTPKLSSGTFVSFLLITNNFNKKFTTIAILSHDTEKSVAFFYILPQDHITQ